MAKLPISEKIRHLLNEAGKLCDEINKLSGATKSSTPYNAAWHLAKATDALKLAADFMQKYEDREAEKKEAE
jgi:hypothetical protein